MTRNEKVAWLNKAADERVKKEWPDLDPATVMTKRFYISFGEVAVEVTRPGAGLSLRIHYDETLVGSGDVQLALDPGDGVGRVAE